MMRIAQHVGTRKSRRIGTALNTSPYIVDSLSFPYTHVLWMLSQSLARAYRWTVQVFAYEAPAKRKRKRTF